MAYTDPTGYWGRREQQWLRSIAAVAISVYTAGTETGASWGLFGTSVSTGQAIGATLVGGFAAGGCRTPA
jgi:hypothetical protein